MRLLKYPMALVGTLLASTMPLAAQEPVPDPAIDSLVGHLLDRRTREITDLLADWRAASGAAKTALEAYLTDLAVERRAYLEETMRRDAARAWANLLNAADRTDLDSIAPDNTAQEATISGELEVMVLEDLDGGASTVSRILVRAGGLRTHVYPVDAEGELFVSGGGVTLIGRLLGERFVFRGPLPPGGCNTPTTGTLDYLLVRADFTDAPLPASVTEADLELLYNGSPSEPISVKDYFAQASYGRLNLVSTVLPGGPLDLGINAVFDPSAVLAATVTALEAQSVDLSAYDGLVIFMDWRSQLPPPGTPQYPLRNQATTGRIEVQTSNGPVCISVSYMGDRWEVFPLNLHETGHTLGMLHASSYDEPTIARPLASSNIVNYGDPLSIMGYNPPNAGHVNVQHKQLDLGWIASSEYELVDPATLPKVVTLAPISVDSSELKGIKIPRGGGDALYIEFRYALPGARYDKPFVLDDTGAFTEVENGGLQAYIRDVPTRRTLIFEPGGTNLAASALKASTNETFVDPCTGVRVTALSIDTSGSVPTMDVELSKSGVPCTQFVAPSVDIVLPAEGATISGTVTVRAIATDDVGVDSVQFLAGEKILGSVTTPVPGTTDTFELVWDTTDPTQGVANGPQLLSAIADDVAADNCCPLSTKSESVAVTVQNGGGSGAPAVAWVSPPTGSNVLETFNVSATSSDVDGVAAVEFWCDPNFADPCSAGEQFDGRHPDECLYHAWFPAYSAWFDGVGGGSGAFLVGVTGPSDTSPFTATVDALPPGTYSMWARSFDNRGDESTTAPVSVTVTSDTALSVELPVAAGSFVPAGGTFALVADVSSVPGEVAYVDFFVGEALIARDDAAPFEASWNVPSGAGQSHVLSAVVAGLGGRSAFDAVTVVSE